MVEAGQDVDPESLMTSEEILDMVDTAQTILEDLEEKQESLIMIKLEKAKEIKCPHCDHKGQSIVEEHTPIFVTLFVCILPMTLGFVSLILIPCIVPLFLQITHRCPRCLNEIKEDSLFAQLNDNIISFRMGNFGVLITKRTILQGLAFLILTILALFLLKYYLIGGIPLTAWHLKSHTPNFGLHWSDFSHDILQSTSKRQVWSVFEQKY